MKHKVVSCIAYGILVVLVTLNIAAEPEWVKTSPCTDSLWITHMISYQSSVIFGTRNHGLFYLDGTDTINYNIGTLCVTDIVMSDNFEIFVSVGNGSKSDAIYHGQSVLDGAPYYVFERLFYFHKPTSVGYHNDTLLIGTDRSISISCRKENVFKEPVALTLPDNTFAGGSYCSDIIYSTRFNAFCAGMEDSPLAMEESFILFIDPDTIIAPFKCTARSIKEVSGFSYTPNIYLSRKTALHRLSVRGEQYTSVKINANSLFYVNDIESFAQTDSKNRSVETVVVATTAGIYTMLDGGNTLTELGTIRNPTCVVYAPSSGVSVIAGRLFAGSDYGIYTLDIPTEISSDINIVKSQVPSFVIVKNSIQINLNRENSDICSIKFFDMAGKLAYKTSSNKNSVNINLDNASIGTGQYLVTIESANIKYSQKIMLVK